MGDDLSYKAHIEANISMPNDRRSRVEVSVEDTPCIAMRFHY